MGRKATHPNLPKGMLARKRSRKDGSTTTYYFYNSRQADGSRKEIPLGKDYILAVQQWAKLEQDKIKPNDKPTFNLIVSRYLADKIHTLSIGTQRLRKQYIKKLLIFFDNAPLEEITPQHMRQYLDWRRDVPKQANNEFATFSTIWNCAREWGYTDRPNPCLGVKKFPAGKREVYIENDLYQLVYEAANQQIRDLMDIAYLIGQRPVDVVKIHSNDIKDGILNITQQKTKAQLRFEITGDLKSIIDRLMPSEPNYLFNNKRGKRLTANILRKWFLNLREKIAQTKPEYATALKNFQFRDLRAKSATDIYLNGSIDEAQKQLGHTTPNTTRVYVRKVKMQQPLASKPVNDCGKDK